MRFIWGSIPPSRTLDARAAGWNQLRSVAPQWAMAQAAAGMVLCLAVAGWALKQAADHLPVGWFLVLLVSPAMLVPIHELLHAVGYGVDPRSSHLLTGIWPSHGVWFVLWDSPLRRNRVLLMLVAPLLALTVVPALLAVLLEDGARWTLAYLAAMHATLGVGDLLTFGRILRQVPTGGWVHNSGWETFWTDASGWPLPTRGPDESSSPAA